MGVDFLAGTAAHVAWCKEEDRRSFGRVHQLLHQDDLVYSLAVLLDQSATHPFARSTLGRFLALPDVTRGGVMATFAQQTRLRASDAVQASLERNSLDPSVIESGEPFTVF